MRRTTSLLLTVLLPLTMAWGQKSVTMRGSFSNFVTFYISSIDLNTLQSDVEIFNYLLAADSQDQYPVQVRITFDILINSPALGLTYDDKFAHIVTEYFELKGDLRIKSTALKNPPDPLFYEDRSLGSVEFGLDGEPYTIMNEPGYNSDALINQVIQSGRLPDGAYRFDLSVDVLDGSGDNSSETILISNPIALELISPGSELLEDTTANIISTSYPFFQWQSDPCATCDYLIRVAQFVPGEHSGLEDAIEDQTVLPLLQFEEFYNPDGNGTTFQYPFSGAIDLLPGKVYVWQVQKVIPTTEGDNEIPSPLFVFKVLDPTATTSSIPASTGDATADAAQNPVLGFIQTAMGEDQFNSLFGDGGDLYGFRPNATMTLNGSSISTSDLTNIANALSQGGAKITSVEVQ